MFFVFFRAIFIFRFSNAYHSEVTTIYKRYPKKKKQNIQVYIKKKKKERNFMLPDQNISWSILADAALGCFVIKWTLWDEVNKMSVNRLKIYLEIQ